MAHPWKLCFLTALLIMQAGKTTQPPSNNFTASQVLMVIASVLPYVTQAQTICLLRSHKQYVPYRIEHQIRQHTPKGPIACTRTHTPENTPFPRGFICCQLAGNGLMNDCH